MSSRHQIDDFMRGRIIGKIEEGRNITDVAREFDIAHSVVSRLWKSFKTTGMCSRRHGGGRVRSTTPAEDRYTVLSAKRNRRTTAQQVANQFLAASGKKISRKTVARRLRGGGLYARRPVVCVPLTRQHRTARLQWCREHHNWTEQDWACVLFSDESRFSLSSDCRRQLIWRESGTRKYPGKGPISDMQYHGDCLDSEGIQCLVWPVRSPDLNPIENVWDALGWQVAGRNYPPTNKNTLIRALTEEWYKLPQQLLDNVVQTTKKTTRRQYRRIVRQALVDPTVTRSTIRADVGVAIVPQTISRHLSEANLKSKRPFRAFSLTPEHRQLRLQWCQARSMWNVTDWQKVVFSDESRFVLGTDDNRVRVWRRPAYDSRSRLIVMCGTLTGQRYIDDILRPHVGPFVNGLSGAIFQQDNARPYTARVAQDFIRRFQTLPWPARSPDLSPVKHEGDQLKRQMPSCHSVHDLELVVKNLWAHLPQDDIRCPINSMPDRVAACIAAGGGPTHY
ncbi:transposable element Tcb2 transposase [Trichonephila clavipes]|nr:transposable element Tcb2 transposase [Trichonephila clavipes]